MIFLGDFWEQNKKFFGKKMDFVTKRYHRKICGLFPCIPYLMGLFLLSLCLKAHIGRGLGFTINLSWRAPKHINFKGCVCYFLFFHLLIALKKIWKTLFILSKYLFLFWRCSRIWISILLFLFIFFKFYLSLFLPYK